MSTYPNKHKLQAYTLLEIVTTLFIIGLLVFFSYSIMIFLNTQMENYKKENLEMADVMDFSNIFSRDLYASQDLEFAASSVELTGYDGKKILYSIADGKMSKIVDQKESKFDIGVIGIYHKQVKNELRVVEFIEIATLMRGDTINLKFSKEAFIADY